MLTIKGFTLIEVIIAFTITIMGLALVYGSLGIVSGRIILRMDDEDMVSYTTAFVYEKANVDFVIREHIDIEGETCQVLENRINSVILTVCPYLSKNGEVYANIIKVKVKDKWLLIPK